MVSGAVAVLDGVGSLVPGGGPSGPSAVEEVVDAAIDLLARGASLSMGIKHSVAVRAHVAGVGVFNLAWKEPVRIVVPPGLRTRPTGRRPCLIPSLASEEHL